MKINNLYIKKIIICIIAIFTVSLFGILLLNVKNMYAGCCFKDEPYKVCIPEDNKDACGEGYNYTSSDCNTICPPKGEEVKFENPLGYSDMNQLIIGLVKYALGLIGIITIIMIIIGGFSYMTAAGNEEQIKKAKKIITGALIGLVIVALSLVIVSFIETAIGLTPGI